MKIMEIATSNLIRKIDAFAEKTLGIPTIELMGRSGEAVCDCVLQLNSSPSMVLILAGGGNNGGDGYAAALRLRHSCEVRVIDVFFVGQRSDAGKYYLSECEKLGIVERGTERALALLKRADIVVDAIFGIGFSGEVSPELSALSRAIGAQNKKVIAVDIPLGISADTAQVSDGALRADVTVALCRYKPAHLSYPAKEYMGKIRLFDINLGEETPNIPKSDKYLVADLEFAKTHLPKREANTNKGSFGHALHITGSDKYVGAAMLSLEAALRGGIGLVTHLGELDLQRELRARFPEAIYSSLSDLGDSSGIIEYSRKYSSILVGPGSSVNRELFSLIANLIGSEGAPLIIDADGINSIAEFSSPEIFKTAKRSVILTPHPREMSRISGESVEYINSHRISFAESFAREYGVVLLLKGAATVITDGTQTVINTSGNSALAKGGSGDVLSGIISSLVPSASSPLIAASLGAYLHGRAADVLSLELSEFGVTPSDLPKAIAKEISTILTK